MHVCQAGYRLWQGILLAQAEQLAFVAVVDAGVVLGNTTETLSEAFAAFDDDAHLIGAHDGTVLVGALVEHVDLAILEPLLDFEALEVECVRVKVAERFEHGVSARVVVCSVVAVHEDCGNKAHVVSVDDASELLLDGEHALSTVNRTVQWRGVSLEGTRGVLAQVLFRNSFLVKINDNAALSLAAQPVGVRALHAIRYTAGRSFAVEADQRRAVALQGERLEDRLDSRPTLHNVVLNPGNSDFAVLGIDWPATWVLDASPGTTGRGGVVLLRSRISAVRGFVFVNVSGAGASAEVGCWQRVTRTPENVIRATVREP
jgi:hypothetical protein